MSFLLRHHFRGPDGGSKSRATGLRCGNAGKIMPRPRASSLARQHRVPEDGVVTGGQILLQRNANQTQRKRHSLKHQQKSTSKQSQNQLNSIREISMTEGKSQTTTEERNGHEICVSSSICS